MNVPRNFAVVGVAGFVAPRHLRAIRDTGNRLVAAMDPSDTVGVLDQFDLSAEFVREEAELAGVLANRLAAGEERRVHWVSVCSPSHRHGDHVQLALRHGADVLCEKPLVLTPAALDTLAAAESSSGRRVFTVLQLRLHPAVRALAARLALPQAPRRHQVELRYVTARGGWYRRSWKGDEARSGGLALNIGIHLFDLLLWLFGAPRACAVQRREPLRMAGALELDRADVRWSLSVDPADLPFAVQPGARSTWRALVVDGVEVELSDGFADLHTALYARTLAGEGFGIAEARPAIELAHRVRTMPLVAAALAPAPPLPARREAAPPEALG